MSVKRILIIDDEDDIREVAQLCLETLSNWEVITAASSTEGFVMASSHNPDAILLDMMMPDMSDPDTFKLLTENITTQNIPVILLTSKIHPSEKQKFAGLGVKAVLPKPFNPMTLPNQLADVLGWHF